MAHSLMMRKSQKNYYLKQGRLSDVIVLISALALEKWDFRRDDGLKQTLNSSPNSAESWHQIAQEHPEFFRINHAGDAMILLLRFLSREIIFQNGKNVEIYKPLTLDQTQKLIEHAITLHDKQIARLQKNSYLIPLITTLLTVFVTSLTAYFTFKANDPTNIVVKKLDSVSAMINSLKVVSATPIYLDSSKKP